MILVRNPSSILKSSTKLLVILLISCNMAIASMAPWTSGNLTRKVTPNHRPKLNDPCDFMLYKHYMTGVRDCAADGPFTCSTGEKDVLHTKPNQFMDPKYMCIKTDHNYNLDMNEFDCLPDTTDYQQIKGYCGCGSRFSQIDFNDPDTKPRLNLTTYSYEYLSFKTFHKGLTMQKRSDGTFECVASHFNHCTLKQNNKPGRHVTECVTGLLCLNISVTHPTGRFPFYNTRTKEWYGICLHPNTEGQKENPFSFAWRKENGFSQVLVILCIICQLLYHHITYRII